MSWETALWLGDQWYKYMQDTGTFVNGFLYWIAHKHGLGRLILALDIKKMRFLEIEFPTKRTFSSVTLESWSQIYSLNLLSRGNYLYGFEPVSILDEGKIVMLKDSNQVIIHDITKDSNKEVKALTTPYDISRRQIIEYVETLVSPSNLLLLMMYRSFNKFTWYKNKALYTRIAAYSDQTRPNPTFVSTSWRHLWDHTLGTTLIRMRAMANATHIVTTVTKTTNKEKESDAAPGVNIQDFCEEHYEDILSIIMEKARRDKQKEVQTRLNFENFKKTQREMENSLNSRAENSPARFHPESSRIRDLRDPSHSRGHSHSRERPRMEDRSRGTEESYGNTYSQGTKTKYIDRSRNIKRWRESKSPSSRGLESDTSNEGHWKSRIKRRKLANEDDMAEPWTCVDVDPFTS
ncbi:hypothetical protein Tco_0966817 [Tanacetum coccineum]